MPALWLRCTSHQSPDWGKVISSLHLTPRLMLYLIMQAVQSHSTQGSTDESSSSSTGQNKLIRSTSNTVELLRSIRYISQALQYIARNCKHLGELSLWLPNLPASSNRGGPLDHPSLLKRPHFKLTQLWSHCQRLQRLTLVNVPSRYTTIAFSALNYEALMSGYVCLQYMQAAPIYQKLILCSVVPDPDIVEDGM